jgi:hypothetical protein
VRQPLVFDIDFQRACQRCQVFRKHFLYEIQITGAKRYTAVRVLVRFPLHAILSVEAAFASAIGAKASEKMQANVRGRDIATTVI